MSIIRTKLTTEIFIERASTVHNNKFDYSLVEYTNVHGRVKIICPVHGIFEQKANSHLNGSGCYECSGKKRNSEEDFIKKMKQIHIDKGTPNYDYSKVVYKNLDTKISITCPTHGEFLITPRSVLLQHAGCTQCGNELSGKLRRTTQQDFINQANQIHNNKYDYTKTVYSRSDKNIIITCPIHGDFLQTPSNHLQKSECPNCANELKGGLGGYTQEYFKNNPDRCDIPAVLYAAHITNGNEKFIKIGITAKTTHHRFNRGEYKNMVIDILYEKTTTLYEAFSIEQQFIDSMKNYKFFSNTKFSGYTECFQVKPDVVNQINNLFNIPIN